MYKALFDVQNQNFIFNNFGMNKELCWLETDEDEDKDEDSLLIAEEPSTMITKLFLAWFTGWNNKRTKPLIDLV